MKLQISILIFLIFFCSCKKNEIYPEEPIKKNENLIPSDFDIKLSNLSSNSVIATWDIAFDPEYSEVSYNLYLNDKSIASKLQKNFFLIENLSPSTKYTLKIEALDEDHNTRVKTIQFTTEDGTLKFVKDYKLFKNTYLSNQTTIDLKDGRFIIAGYTIDNVDGSKRPGVLYQISAEGNKIWSKYFDLGIHVESITMKFFLQKIPGTSDFLYAFGNKVYRLNAQGDIVWSKNLMPLELNNEFTALLLTNNSQLVLITKKREFIKIDLNGDLLSFRQNLFDTEVVNDLVEDSKGDLFVSGYNYAQHWLGKFTSSGALIWEKKFINRINNQQERNYNSTKLLIDKLDNVYYLGYVYDFYFFRYFKFDNSGKLLVNTSVNEIFQPNSAVFTSENTILVLGTYHGNGLNIYPVLKSFDVSFNLKWERRYNEFAPMGMNQIFETSDNGYFAIMANYGIKMNNKGDYE